MDLLKYLISRWGNSCTTDDNGDNIAHMLLTFEHDDLTVAKQCMEYLMSLPNAATLFKMKNKQERTALHEWIKYGSLLPDPDTIKLILTVSQEDVNATDTCAETMFLSAARNEDALACLKCLKEVGADEAVTNQTGGNALHISAETGNLEYAKYLLSIGVPLEHQDNQNRTPLLLSPFSQNVDVMKYFIAQHANVAAVDDFENNIAHMLFERCNPKIVHNQVEYLLSLPEAPQLFKMTNELGMTPLHYWISSVNVLPDSKTIKTILRISGEDVNATDINKATMFMNAAEKPNSLSCLKTLKDSGADHLLTDSSGYTALHFASISGTLASVLYLVSLGISAEAQDFVNGSTPLIWAAKFHQFEVMKYLIEAKANVLAFNFDGNNVAHMLILTIYTDTGDPVKSIEYLMSLPQAADIFKMTNHNGRTPLQEWIESERSPPQPEIISQIQKICDESINASSGIGNTAYSTAPTKMDFWSSLKCMKNANCDRNDVAKHDGKNEIGLAKGRGTKRKLEDYTIQIDENGDNIAHLAAKEYWDYEFLESLINQNNAHLLFSATNFAGKTPLDYLFAITFPQLENIELLLSFPGIVVPTKTDQQNLFLLAIEKGHGVKVQKLLIENGADPFSVNRCGKTALHLAAEQGNLEVTQYLVSLGLPLELRDYKGNTPLLLSTANTTNVAKFLVSQKANIFSSDAENNNIAHKWLGIDFLKAGITYKADIQHLLNSQNQAGRIPIHHWIKSGVAPSPEAFSKLLEISGVDVNRSDFYDRTVLATAISMRYDVDVLEGLVSLGADPNRCGGGNALHYSAKARSRASAEYFLSLDVSLETEDCYGNTPLLLAAALADIEMIKYFISQQANVHAVNKEGDNMAHILTNKLSYKDRVSQEILEYLVTLSEGCTLFEMRNKFGATPLMDWKTPVNVPTDVESAPVDTPGVLVIERIKNQHVIPLRAAAT